MTFTKDNLIELFPKFDCFGEREKKLFEKAASIIPYYDNTETKYVKECIDRVCLLFTIISNKNKEKKDDDLQLKIRIAKAKAKAMLMLHKHGIEGVQLSLFD